NLARSGGKKETKAMVFHKIDTKEVSDRFVAPCFVNGLEAYDGEINLGEKNDEHDLERICLWEETMLKPDHRDPNTLDNMKQWKRYCFYKFIMISYYRKVATMRRSLEIDDMLRIKLCEAESNEEIFTFVAWIRAFNIKEPISAELCHEFYSTYEFDEVCADDELQTKKIIKFRLGGCAHNLTLLEFARRLGLYHVMVEEDGSCVYFQGGVLRSDDHFNVQEYWLSISREENLGLSRSHASTTRNPNLRVMHKMITYGLCQRTSGYDKIQKNDLWLLSMFDARHQNGYANVAWLIARWMKRKGVDLDTTTLRELIDSEGRLIPGDPQTGVPRVGIPRPPRASMPDLYDSLGSMEIRQEVIERMGEHITHLVMLSRSMINIISSTHLSHHSIHRSISNSRMMTSSVEMTQDGCVIAYHEKIELNTEVKNGARLRKCGALQPAVTQNSFKLALKSVAIHLLWCMT
ncbi:hypothetical protein Tco_1009155, partial [Tanacetum coccineum]